MAKHGLTGRLRTSTNEYSFWVWVQRQCWVHQQLVVHPLISLRALNLAIQEERLRMQHTKRRTPHCEWREWGRRWRMCIQCHLQANQLEPHAAPSFSLGLLQQAAAVTGTGLRHATRWLVSSTTPHIAGKSRAEASLVYSNFCPFVQYVSPFQMVPRQ